MGRPEGMAKPLSQDVPLWRSSSVRVIIVVNELQIAIVGINCDPCSIARWIRERQSSIPAPPEYL